MADSFAAPAGSGLSQWILTAAPGGGRCRDARSRGGSECRQQSGHQRHRLPGSCARVRQLSVVVVHACQLREPYHQRHRVAPRYGLHDLQAAEYQGGGGVRQGTVGRAPLRYEERTETQGHRCPVGGGQSQQRHPGA